MGVRRLLVLVEGIPNDSAVGRAATDGWTRQDELQALAVEHLDGVIAGIRALGGDKTVRRHKPLRIPRPHDKPKEGVGWTGLARMLMGGG